jgi:STAS-like domain of unknown function (DUF4325)
LEEALTKRFPIGWKKVMRYNIHEITGQCAISSADGKQLFDSIHPKLNEQEPVELDFAGVNIFASAFFNVAIGQLLQDIPNETIEKNLTITHLSPNGAIILEQVIENAKLYYSDPSQKAAVDTVMEEYAASF